VRVGATSFICSFLDAPAADALEEFAADVMVEVRS
jgi:hypothetical protein